MSCTVMPPPDRVRRAEPVLYEWHDDYGPGKVRVHIDLSEQRANYFREDRWIGWSFVATGKEGYGTRPGTYRISEKLEEKWSTKYGWIEDEYGNMIEPDATAGDRVPPGCRYVPAPMPQLQSGNAIEGFRRMATLLNVVHGLA